MPNIFDEVVSSRFESIALYIEMQTVIIVPRGCSHKMSWRSEDDFPMHLIRKQMKIAYFRNIVTTRSSCTSVLVPCNELVPIVELLPSAGEALPHAYLAYLLPFRYDGFCYCYYYAIVNCLVALVYTKPPELAPIMRIRVGFCDIAGRRIAGRQSASSAIGNLRVVL